MAMNDLREVERPTKQEEQMPRDTSFTPFRMLDSVRLGHWPKNTEMAPVTRYSPIQKTRTLDRTNGFMGSQPLRPQSGIHHMLRVTIMVRHAPPSLPPSLPLPPSLSLSWAKNLNY